jgi:YD repeat-containing protein
VVAINPDDKRVTYSYDFMDRRVVMRNPEGGRFSSTYDAKGRLIRHVNPQGKKGKKGDAALFIDNPAARLPPCQGVVDEPARSIACRAWPWYKWPVPEVW